MKTRHLLILYPLLVLMIAGMECKSKKRQLDPRAVVEDYFAALEKRNFKRAYDYLSEEPRVVIAGGKRFLFAARPNFETFEKSYSSFFAEFRAIKIEPREDLSAQGQLAVFDAEASIRRTTAAEATIERLRVFLAPDSAGRWFVLLPASEPEMLEKPAQP